MIGKDYFSQDTICAIATSMAGDAGIGVLRLSGDKSLSIAKSVTQGFDTPVARFLHRVIVRDTSKADIDDGLAVWFEAGASFTGEEVVELQLHGGRFVLRKVLALLMEAGARLAMPGEFTFRAVRNRRLDLSQAQALNQFIHARSNYEVWSARKNLSSSRVATYDRIAEMMRKLLALLELSIDFIDQDVEVVSAQSFDQSLKTIEAAVMDMKQQILCSKRIALGLNVAFYGKPNAGKSTLFNGLLSEDRAIVSSEPGTTRDVITEEIEIGPYRVRLGDTAGIRETKADIEEQGIRKTRRTVEEADIKVLLLDGSSGSSIDVRREYVELQAEAEADILVITKVDQISPLQKKTIDTIFEGEKVNFCFASGVTGEGLLELLCKIEKALDEKFKLGLNLPMPTEIQLTMLERCEQELIGVRQAFSSSGSEKSIHDPEILAVILRRAVNALSHVVGETNVDDTLNKIFSEFCIGK